VISISDSISREALPSSVKFSISFDSSLKWSISISVVTSSVVSIESGRFACLYSIVTVTSPSGSTSSFDSIEINEISYAKNPYSSASFICVSLIKSFSIWLYVSAVSSTFALIGVTFKSAFSGIAPSTLMITSSSSYTRIGSGSLL